MMQLNFPTYPIKIMEKEGRQYVFDPIRKKYIVLTPEENVRQHLLNFLVTERNFPKGLIAVEKGLKVNKMHRRTDVVVYNKTGLARLIVECKAPKVKITQKTFDQAAHYNISLKVNYLMVTNGLVHYCCKINLHNKTYDFLPDIPYFKELSTLSEEDI